MTRLLLALLLFNLTSAAEAQWGVSKDFFVIDDAGEITITAEGATAINKMIGNTTFYLDLAATNAQAVSEQHFATIFTCCTVAPTDGPLRMPWVIYQWTKPANTDTGIFQAASATVELQVADWTQLAEGGTISFDGVVKYTCTPGQTCLFPGIEWDASKPVAHTIEGQVKMTNGNVYLTTLQIPASQ